MIIWHRSLRIGKNKHGYDSFPSLLAKQPKAVLTRSVKSSERLAGVQEVLGQTICMVLWAPMLHGVIKMRNKHKSFMCAQFLMWLHLIPWTFPQDYFSCGAGVEGMEVEWHGQKLPMHGQVAVPVSLQPTPCPSCH